MARNAAEQSAISFDPTTFSSGRWDGGRGTVVAEPAPRFEYRTIKGSKGDFIVVEAHLSIEDLEANVHDVKWQAGYGDAIVIRESNDPDSDEAELGPSIFAREPGKQIRLRAQEEWSQLLASLQTQGYPSAKLNKGDLTVFVGLDADWEQYARKKDDKYPILVVSNIFDGKSKGKASTSTTSAGSKTKSSAKPPADDEEEDKPRKKKPSEEANDDARAEEAALEIVIEALGDADEPTTDGTTVGDCIRLASKKLKADPAMKKLVLDLIGGDPAEKGAWITSQAEFKYKKNTNSVVLVED